MADYPQVEELMARELGDWLRSQNSVREDAKDQARNRLWKGALFGGPVWLFLFVLFSYPSFLIHVAILGGSILWWWSQAPKRDAVKNVKIAINEAVADALGLKYQYDVKPGPEFALAKESGMLPHYGRASFEDSWAGEYRGHVFSLYEAHLERREGSGKSSDWKTVFRGSILTVGFDREFHGTTLVVRDGSHKKFFGLGGVKDSITLNGQTLDYVDMVHPKFSDAFDVYATDQVEARYLVHPEYIERLIAVENSFKGQDICSLFHSGNLVITLNCGNMFESGGMDGQEDKLRIAQTIDQFARLADLAETLQEPHSHTRAAMR